MAMWHGYPPDYQTSVTAQSTNDLYYYELQRAAMRNIAAQQIYYQHPPFVVNEVSIEINPCLPPPTPPKGKGQMNYSTAVFLINNKVRAVVGIYSPEGPGLPTPTRVTFKTLDPTIKVGDYVLVPTSTRHNMSVNKIVEVDVDVDFDSSVPMAWVISKVDKAEYESMLEQEQAAISVIKSAEVRRKREKLRDAVLKDQMDSIKALPIAALNGDTATHD